MRTREAVLYTDDTQRTAALASRRAVERAAGEPIHTAVLPAGRFWPAGTKMQKANLQRVAPDLVRQLAPRFGSRESFLASRPAARLNACVGGFAGRESLDEAAEDLGMPTAELAASLPR